MLRERLLYIDNLRLMVIAFVVMHHLGVTYSGIGSWYYVENIRLDTLSQVWFAFYLGFQQGYFLGLLFMLAGYFVPGSFDRKGFRGFVRDRFKRLIIPSFIYMVAITPFIGYVELGNKWTGFDLVGFLSGTGVMWFPVALFFFSVAYGLVRLISRKTVPASNHKPFELSSGKAVALILIIAVSAFLIRTVQPIGTSILNMQLCFFASYIALFIFGVLAKNNLLANISYRTGKRWLITAIVPGFIAWLALVIAAVGSGPVSAVYGGLTWQSAGYSLWESFIAVSMSIGLITIFREKFNNQTKTVKTLSDNSFAVYMFHPPIIVGVALLLSPVALYPIAKWLVLCIICVPLCFAATHYFFRRIPLLKRVL